MSLQEGDPCEAKYQAQIYGSSQTKWYRGKIIKLTHKLDKIYCAPPRTKRSFAQKAHPARFWFRSRRGA